MKKAFSPRPNKPSPAKKEESSLNFLVSPWFVIALVVICFAILTPKIFLPMFMGFMGLNSPAEPTTHNFADPRTRGNGMPPQGDPRAGPQFGRPGPGYGQPPAAPAQGKSSLLTFLLPIYAVGIGVYMVYTLFKVFKKDEPKEENDSDFEEVEKRNYKFKENTRLLDKANADVSRHGLGKSKSKRTAATRSEESEDELDEYARYSTVDQEYLDYLKEARRQKKLEKNKKKSPVARTAGDTENDEIALTPGTGLTSITNTNVLMNDTLERMKHSLNKINNQLVDVEKKGNPLQDPELDSLKVQLTQTELQMSKIMTIVNTVSATLEKQNIPNQDDEDDPEFIDENDDDDDYAYGLGLGLNGQQMPQQLSKNALRNRRRKAKKGQMKQMQDSEQEDEGSMSSNSLSAKGYSHNHHIDEAYDQYPSSDDDEYDEYEQQRQLQYQLEQQLNLQMRKQQERSAASNAQSNNNSLSNKQSATNQVNVNNASQAAAPLTKSQQKNLKKKQRKKANKANNES